MTNMSLERFVFAPVERIALALHPHRWRLFFATLALVLVPFLLLLSVYLAGSPPPILLRFAAPVLLTLVAWAWSAFLLTMWFGPSQRFPSLSTASRFTGIAALLWFAVRVCSLIFLVAFVLSPAFVWFVLWRTSQAP